MFPKYAVRGQGEGCCRVDCTQTLSPSPQTMFPEFAVRGQGEGCCPEWIVPKP
jgi:hypothetical protein